ncbi:glutamate--tRNA ligase [bacterium]|nr:glutamate--tRNA ligase [bacterium]
MIRVRFAPSPTGFLHIGGLRTCLYNWLFARKNKGKLILRIEDTDRERFLPESIFNLLKTLEECGLDWDEGPVLSSKNTIKQKGRYGPYIQSQRLKIYQNFAKKLVDLGAAYYCFCSKQRLEELRKTQISLKIPPRYDKHCRNLSPEQVKKNLKSNIPYVIRLKVPDQGKIKFKDIIRGEIEFELKNIDDQILLKSDGWPTYHLASVVDDHLMKISHIIRGEEWLSSVPKHLLIYNALKWKPPKMAHLPLLLNPDLSKLSKRKGDVSVESFLQKGYLPEALLNFIALLGWNPGNDEEIFSLKQLIRLFSLKKVGKSGAVFNREKLLWMNGYYIRKMPIDKLAKYCLKFLIQEELITPIHNKKTKFKITATGEIVQINWLKKIIALEQERLKELKQIVELSEFFFKEPKYEAELLFWKKMTKNQVKENLESIKTEFSKIPISKFKKPFLEEIILKLAEKRGRGEVFWPLRAALTGKKASPPPLEIAEILGREKTIQRIDKAIKML